VRGAGGRGASEAYVMGNGGASRLAAAPLRLVFGSGRFWRGAGREKRAERGGEGAVDLVCGLGRRGALLAGGERRTARE
jgi:hypothetical protein